MRTWVCINNLRPISNLSYISKLVETVADQLKCYYDEIFIFFSNHFSPKCKIQMQTKGNYHESSPALIWPSKTRKNSSAIASFVNLNSAVFYISRLSCGVIHSTMLAWATEIHRVSVDSACLSSENESEQSFNLDDMACIHNSEVWNSSHGAGSYPHMHWEWNIFDSLKMHVKVLISFYQNWN